MKNKYSFLIAFVLFTCAADAQTSRTVDFNTFVSGSDNDLMNNFTGGFNLIQQTTGGITGGSVLPAATLSTNKAIFNTHLYLRPGDPNATSVSISFKYSVAGAASGDGGPEIGFKLTTDSAGSPAGGFVTANISNYPFGGSMFSIDGAINHYTSSSFNLVDGHWYQLQLKINAINNDTIDASSYIYELGVSGTSSPGLISSFVNNKQYTPGITWPHSFFLATLNGGASGGVVAMDNFNTSYYYAPSGINKVAGPGNIVISNPVTTHLSVLSESNHEVSYVISNYTGTRLLAGNITGAANIDISALPASLYFIQFTDGGQVGVQKFCKQ